MIERVVNFLIPVLILVFIKTVILKMFIFQRYLQTREGDATDTLWYNTIFPALVVNNFIIAQTYALIRASVAVFFSFVRTSRLDTLCVPVEIQEKYNLDWGYLSFISVCGLAAKEYNPTARMSVEIISGQYQRLYATWYPRKTDKDDINPDWKEAVEARQRKDRIKRRWHLA